MPGRAVPSIGLLFLLFSCVHPPEISSPPDREPTRILHEEILSIDSPASPAIRMDVPEGVPAIAGRSVEARPVHYMVFGRGADVALIFATIHGNEPAGTPLVNRLALHLERHPELLEGRRVVLCPLLNPDGLANRTRWNVHGVDLNRNYPSDNFKPCRRHGPRPLSEPESRIILDLLTTFQPDRVLSIHQPLSCIDYDGPARDLAEAMGRTTGLPVKKLGARPGSLGSYVGLTLGIPIITLELPGAASRFSADRNWAKYGNMLLAFIRHGEGIQP